MQTTTQCHWHYKQHVPPHSRVNKCLLTTDYKPLHIFCKLKIDLKNKQGATCKNNVPLITIKAINLYSNCIVCTGASEQYSQYIIPKTNAKAKMTLMLTWWPGPVEGQATKQAPGT